MIESSLPQSEPVMLPARSFGRVTRSVLAHGTAAALMAAARLLVFVPAAIFHCGARNGRRSTWIALAVAIALFAVQTAVIVSDPKEDANRAWMFFTSAILAIALPASAAYPLVERAEKFGRTLLVLLAGAGIGLAATELILREVRSFSAYALTVTSAQKTLSQLMELYRDNQPPAIIVRVIEMFFDPRVQSAIALIDTAMVFVLSLMLIGRLRAWRDSVATRVGPEATGAYLFRNFALPEWLLFAFLFGGLTPVATGMLQTIAANVLIVVGFLYMLQGLAIYRALLLAMGIGMGGTIFAWTFMAFGVSTGVACLPLAIAGLFDPFFDFRHFKRKDDSHESHTD